ncbi:MAG: secondary thiamine-phosphate synthase enzyme YjbQ [Planctomycetota bacterium]|jgi:secondary thiamine-phosphate synthase enzyme
MEILSVGTRSHDELVDITGQVQAVVKKSGVKSGICTIYCPHTTAGITINENADPSVKSDILMELDKRIPWNDGYSHSEGNSAAHVKSSLIGASETVLIQSGRLALGTWQGIMFAEFDGPRNRKVHVHVLRAE